MATVPAPLAQSTLKSHIVVVYQRNQLLWQHRYQNPKNVGLYSRRLAGFPLLLLPHSLHIHSLSLQVRRSFLLPRPPLSPLLRPCTPPLSFTMSSLNSPNQDSNPTKTVKVVIKGRVQGVFYRNWTVDNATELGLKGWVRNRRDGSVEALFSGSPEKVEEMQQRCRRGPPAAMVTGFNVFPCNDDPGTGFERRPTA